jgi:hypothetical protein
MRIVVSCVVVVVSLSLCSRAYALTETSDVHYFDFTLPQNVLADGQEITVAFTWDIQGLTMAGQKRLTVKPISSVGAVEVYSDVLGKYVGMADVTSAFPYLQHHVKLRFKGIQGLESPALVQFVIADTLTRQKYETRVKKVWGTAYYKRYTAALNENILKTSHTVVPAPALSNTASSTVSTFHDPVKLYLWYLSPAFFLYGLLKSPHGFG